MTLQLMLRHVRARLFLIIGHIVPAAAIAVLLLAAGDGLADPDKHDVHVGWLVGSPRLAAVAIDVTDGGRHRNRKLVAYVCDGLGLPAGIVAWFNGELDRDGTATLTSASGQETLKIQSFGEHGASGVFIDAAGQTARFDVTPARGGAGIYNVTLENGLRYRGVSTEGAVLDAQADTQGRVEGTIRHKGERVRFRLHALALLSRAELAEHGLPQEFPDFAAHAQLPDQYVAVITPGGRYWMGRNGDVRGGAAGAAIIGLDKADRR